MTDTPAPAAPPALQFTSIRTLLGHVIKETRGYADSMRYTYDAPARADEMHALADLIRDHMEGLVPAPRFLPIPTGELRLANGVRLEPFKAFANFQEGAISKGHTWRTKSGLGIIATHDLTDRFGVLLHVSVSRMTRNPTWEEIKMVRDLFFPADVDVQMMLPKTADYVNIHQFTFQMTQTPTEWGLR